MLADVTTRGLVASLRDGEARKAIAVGGWEAARQTIVVVAAMRGLDAHDALAAFGLRATDAVKRNGRGRRPGTKYSRGSAKAERR